MIMIKNTGSELFEEAYFILNNKKASRISEYDMMKEANRIVENNSFAVNNNTGKHTSLASYLLGVICGIGITGLLVCFII